MNITSLYQINIEMLIIDDVVQKITLIDGFSGKIVTSSQVASQLGPVKPPPPPPTMSKEQLEALIEVLHTYIHVT